MFWNWFSGRRREKLFQRPWPQAWARWVADHVWHWHVLDDPQRHRLQGLVQIFVQEKNLEGCDGLKVTEEMRVTIAAAACLLLIGFNDRWCFDRADTILVYPQPKVERNLRQSNGLVETSSLVSGLASPGGTIVLSWRDVWLDCRDYQNTRNVVIHEFAHHVDGVDGDMEGIPPFATAQLRDRWHQLAKAELANLREASRLNLPTVLDPYGAENLAELFAVATEAFFCDGLNLSAQHPEMYQLLAALYQIDSQAWFAGWGDAEAEPG